MENPIKMEDLGVPLFLETSIYDIRTNKRDWGIMVECSVLNRDNQTHSENPRSRCGQTKIQIFRKWKKAREY